MVYPHSMTAIPSLRDFSRQAVAAALAALAPALAAEPFLLIDATAGNGQDTLFLADSAAPFPRAATHGFDIQPKALERAAARLFGAGAAPGAGAGRRVHLHLAGHETAVETLGAFYAPAPPPRPAVVMFNLGFLPAADRRLTTRAATTVAALESLLPLLVPGGLISAHMYLGHPGGAEEAGAVRALIENLPEKDWSVALYAYPNKRLNPETLALVERRAD